MIAKPMKTLKLHLSDDPVLINTACHAARVTISDKMILRCF